MRQLIDRWELRQPILDLAESGAPLFGTCAGMIVLSRDIAGGEPPVLPLLDVTVERNAFGRQLDSFEAELSVPILGDRPVHAVFIRAPVIERTGPGVDVLARLDDGRVVAVRERNVVATAFHPELAGETRFHRLVATMASEHHEPGEGAGRRPHPTRRAPRRPMTATRPPRSPGKVRAARLTDLAALGELSRLCQSDDSATRSLGLPVSGPPIGVFSLFRLPLGAFRPNDLMYVYEQDGRIAGLVRVERESTRDEWTIVELDAVGLSDAGDIRYRLVQQLLREGAKRGAARFHVACADADGNVEMLMQAGFMRYGEEHILVRAASAELPAPWSDEAAAKARHPPRAGHRRPRAASPVLHGDTQPGRPARGGPPARLGAPGHPLAGPALQPRPDPALRRRRGLRPGVEGRRQGRDAARRAGPDRRRQGRPAALSEGRHPSGRGRDSAHRVRSGHHRSAHREGRRPSSRPRGDRTRANL